ncbi:DUF4337 domain-containing protein [Flavobacteriaceae bacterium F89]|uniref:DUF4337 domain-containing protein n=1 Tax=Cerina litoralis TaxID=2874477 RepID=A0AAE3JNJ1_9FLAO|nr:DUF4337 domain-containing protein [Cerina litoralis]MCG2461010.1 DUF4337 domain-containing protein [Cerina litoralis]
MTTSEKKGEQIIDSPTNKRTQMAGGILIVFFAVLMGIVQLGNSNLGEKMMIVHNKLGSYSNWYQSKSIKQILKESELDYLQTLLGTGLVDDNKTDAVKTKIETTKSMVLKYEAEKTEILVGSANIPMEYWAQDLDGEMGKIIGVKEWWAQADAYEMAAQKFDLGVLFFQISIVLGAVCIIIYDHRRMQQVFIGLMIIFGMLGTAIAGYGYSLIP